MRFASAITCSSDAGGPTLPATRIGPKYYPDRRGRGLRPRSAREGEAMSIAGELARFLTGTSVNDLPPRALERARMVIASTIASAAMGVDIVSARIIRELAKERGGAPEA